MTKPRKMDLEAKFEALVEQSLVGIYIIEGGVLRYVNPGFAHIFGFAAADELINRITVADLVAPNDRAQIVDNLQLHLVSEPAEIRQRFTALKKDGSEFNVEIFARSWHHEGRPAVIGVLIDVTDLCRAEARLARQAFYDPLTNLPNRALFFDRLQQAIANARREDHLIAFLFLDLDGFKRVNDLYGHAVGDQLLTAVAGRFASTLRATDTIARLGGDEFGIIATSLTFGDDVIPVAEKLIASLASPVVVSEHALTIGVSIGIALFPHHASNPDELYRAADAAMYGAKDKHRGGYCFYTEGKEAPPGS